MAFLWHQQWQWREERGWDLGQAGQGGDQGVGEEGAGAQPGGQAGAGARHYLAVRQVLLPLPCPLLVAAAPRCFLAAPAVPPPLTRSVEPPDCQPRLSSALWEPRLLHAMGHCRKLKRQRQ